MIDGSRQKNNLRAHVIEGAFKKTEMGDNVCGGSYGFVGGGRAGRAEEACVLLVSPSKGRAGAGGWLWVHVQGVLEGCT